MINKSQKFEIGKNDVLQALNINFGFPIVETCIGCAIEVNAYEAFIYSVVTGSGYLDSKILPFSPKGLVKIFRDAFDYKFVTGIFENRSIKYSPLYLSKVRPFLFTNNKYIIPLEFDSEKELLYLIDKIINILSENKLDSRNFLIQRVECSKSGNGMEPFMEYLACEFFKRQGYIVENQIPVSHNVGSPDLGGYKTFLLIEAFIKRNVLPLGFHIIELSMLRMNSNYENSHKDKPVNATIVGEAKTSTREVKSQLEKYLNTGLFKEGYEIHPFITRPSNDYLGFFSLDKNKRIICSPPIINYSPPESGLKLDDYYLWLNNYFKFYLLANLENDDIINFYGQTNKSPEKKLDDFVEWVCGISMDELLDYILRRIQ